MRNAAAALQRAAASQGEGVKGTVRVSASEVVGVEVLPSIVARLGQTHPRLTVELVSTNRLQDYCSEKPSLRCEWRHRDRSH